MTAFTAGQILTADDLNSWIVPLFVQKLTATSRNTTTTYTDDPDLTLTIPANTSYEGQAVLMLAGGTTADFKCRLNWTNTATVSQTGIGPGTGVTSVSAGVDVATGATTRLSTTPPGTFFAAGTTTAGHGVWYPVYVEAGASDVDVTIQWAQNTSDATDTTLLEGSWWVMRRVA